MDKRVIFDKKNVLVTGGAGFIGSQLCDELVKTSKVICVDNFLSGDEKNIDHLLSDPNFEFIKHDVSQPFDLEELPELQKYKIQFQGIQEVYNLACPTSPKNFQDNKIDTIYANSYGVINSLEIAKKYDAKYLHFSSSVVYGPRRDDNPKLNESDIGQVDILSDRSCYDEGKRFAETIVKNYQNIYKLDAKIMRLFRVYGPRMKLDDGIMIPDLINSALDNEDLIIFGDENFTTSLCYINDVMDATFKLMDSDIKEPVNIGSDVELNLTKVAQAIIEKVSSKSKIRYENELLFMTPLALPNISLARNELGWMPIVNLDRGLDKTIDDLRASKGLKRVTHAI